jgi:nucleosome binding factor SPN SPT16 subunit
VALSEFPFFVLDVNEIEIVCFERVFFGIKNFDCVIIFKDFTTFKRIDSIPIEYLEELKSYFDSIDVMYSESAMPLKWKDVLQSMRENFEDNLEAGVWKDILEDADDEEEGEDSEDVDPEADYGAENGESESESDFSDYSGESSDVAEEEDLSEEGLSWDELDKQAEEEDRRNAARRGTEKAAAPAKGGKRR